ncbi:hypothetical protein PN497_09005 [Sphaerospermopsis kisseleviana CS-549]|uniref:Uncharacterized protein n=2 Tax=Sphaerospermopsis TaxID=752201 RepID=A0A479ZU13_9CYAN|nr:MULTISPECIES: hypothetical protein [Sphaerospermopsis]MBD2131076.1 hypothetical protein [Sphaerospermopsis sp. FACHB-1094]MDB9441496.1 hypothetical protein [Sphaerospermopsis kisseleviana CS-549]BAZ83732.1 hypothetical protein NIES73_50210 [Sphaerospermopsis kisseleviana NIES-73]GCL36035.1 hypothetical protein SR1949_11350 [Sphaerospermopsis reniformis]
MFDERVTQLATAYQKTVDHIIDELQITASVLAELIQALIDKAREKLQQELENISEIEVQIGSEKYRLVPDEECPGAWKWEAAEMSNVQAQNIAKQLMLTAADNSQDITDIVLYNNNSSLAIIATIESGDKLTVYQQDNKGKCYHNWVTENLNTEEIIAVVYEPIIRYLPPSQNSTSNKTELKEELTTIVNELLGQLFGNQDIESEVFDNATESEFTTSTENTRESIEIEHEFTFVLGSPFEEETFIFWDENTPLPEPPVDDSPEWDDARDIPMAETTYIEEENQTDFTDKQVSTNEIKTEETVTDTTPETDTNKEKNSDKFVETTEEKIETPKRRVAFAPNYNGVVSSPAITSPNQKWVREVEVPIKKDVAASWQKFLGLNWLKMRHKLKVENARISEAAVELLKAYGETLTDGSRIYRSDAFVIRKEGDKYSIHHRRDELSNFSHSLMEFTVNSRQDIKIKVPPTQMLAVERQEFLILAEKISGEKKLPQLENADIRDIANQLGSLAPAGTFATLESFRKTEVLGLLNSALQQAKTDNLTIGEYTISRSRNVEAGVAHLQLHKTNHQGEQEEMVSFTLHKTAEGIIKQVDYLNISDWDLTQLKFISRNAHLFDLEKYGLVDKTKDGSKEVKNIADIPVPLHPALKKVWQEVERDNSHINSSLFNTEEVKAGIRDKLEKSQEMLSVGEQRELYFQLLVLQNLKDDDLLNKIPPLREIMNDLEKWRKEIIANKYTPKTSILRQNIDASIKFNTSSREVSKLSL